MKKCKILSIIYFLVVGLIIFNVENLELFSTALEYVSCGDSKGIPKPIPMLTSWAFTILLIGVPIVLIIFSIITLAKSTVAGNADEMAKARGKLFKKLIATALAFLVVAFTRYVLSTASTTDSDKNTIPACLNCYLFNDCTVDTTTNQDRYKTSEVVTKKNSNITNSTNNKLKSNVTSNKVSTSTSNKSSSNTSVSDGVVPTGNSCGSNKIYKGNKYSLTDSEKKKIAAMIKGEYDGDLAGMKAVASQMANLYEYKKWAGSSCVDTESFYQYITASNSCKWYATYNKTEYNANALKAVEDVIINGNRTLPPYVMEFDWFPNDIVNPLSSDKYIQGQTNVNNVYGGSGIFWCMSKTSYGDANIFFYDTKYKKYLDGN